MKHTDTNKLPSTLDLETQDVNHDAVRATCADEKHSITGPMALELLATAAIDALACSGRDDTTGEKTRMQQAHNAEHSSVKRERKEKNDCVSESRAKKQKIIDEKIPNSSHDTTERSKESLLRFALVLFPNHTAYIWSKIKGMKHSSLKRNQSMFNNIFANRHTYFSTKYLYQKACENSVYFCTPEIFINTIFSSNTHYQTFEALIIAFQLLENTSLIVGRRICRLLGIIAKQKIAYLKLYAAICVIIVIGNQTKSILRNPKAIALTDKQYTTLENYLKFILEPCYTSLADLRTSMRNSCSNFMRKTNKPRNEDLTKRFNRLYKTITKNEDEFHNHVEDRARFYDKITRDLEEILPSQQLKSQISTLKQSRIDKDSQQAIQWHIDRLFKDRIVLKMLSAFFRQKRPDNESQENGIISKIILDPDLTIQSIRTFYRLVNIIINSACEKYASTLQRILASKYKNNIMRCINIILWRLNKRYALNAHVKQPLPSIKIGVIEVLLDKASRVTTKDIDIMYRVERYAKTIDKIFPCDDKESGPEILVLLSQHKNGDHKNETTQPIKNDADNTEYKIVTCSQMQTNASGDTQYKDFLTASILALFPHESTHDKLNLLKAKTCYRRTIRPVMLILKNKPIYYTLKTIYQAMCNGTRTFCDPEQLIDSLFTTNASLKTYHALMLAIKLLATDNKQVKDSVTPIGNLLCQIAKKRFSHPKIYAVVCYIALFHKLNEKNDMNFDNPSPIKLTPIQYQSIFEYLSCLNKLTARSIDLLVQSIKSHYETWMANTILSEQCKNTKFDFATVFDHLCQSCRKSTHQAEPYTCDAIEKDLNEIFPNENIHKEITKLKTTDNKKSRDGESESESGLVPIQSHVNLFFSNRLLLKRLQRFFCHDNPEKANATIIGLIFDEDFSKRNVTTLNRLYHILISLHCGHNEELPKKVVQLLSSPLKLKILYYIKIIMFRIETCSQKSSSTIDKEKHKQNAIRDCINHAHARLVKKIKPHAFTEHMANDYMPQLHRKFGLVRKPTKAQWTIIHPHKNNCIRKTGEIRPNMTQYQNPNLNRKPHIGSILKRPSPH